MTDTATPSELPDSQSAISVDLPDTIDHDPAWAPAEPTAPAAEGWAAEFDEAPKEDSLLPPHPSDVP